MTHTDDEYYGSHGSGPAWAIEIGRIIGKPEESKKDQADFMSDSMVLRGPGDYRVEFGDALREWKRNPNDETRDAVVAVRQQIDDYWQDPANE